MPSLPPLDVVVTASRPAMVRLCVLHSVPSGRLPSDRPTCVLDVTVGCGRGRVTATSALWLPCSCPVPVPGAPTPPGQPPCTCGLVIVLATSAGDVVVLHLPSATVVDCVLGGTSGKGPSSPTGPAQSRYRCVVTAAGLRSLGSPGPSPLVCRAVLSGCARGVVALCMGLPGDGEGQDACPLTAVCACGLDDNTPPPVHFPAWLSENRGGGWGITIAVSNKLRRALTLSRHQRTCKSVPTPSMSLPSEKATQKRSAP